MKRRIRIICLVLVLGLLLQLPALSLRVRAAGEDTALDIQPELSAGVTVLRESLAARGALEDGKFTFGEDTTLSVTVTLEDGWSYSDSCSKVLPQDGTNAAAQENEDGSYTFSRAYGAGETVSSQELVVIINATAAELPKLYITIDGSFSSVTKETWVDATFQLTMGSRRFASGDYSGTGAVKGRGNTSWTYPQKPYSLKLSSKASLLDIPATKKYAIISSYGDSSLMRNYITYKTGLKLLGIDYTPKCEFVAVYLNGTYNGIYLLVERIDIESTKVDIEEATDDHVDGGYIIEKDAGDKVDKSKDPWFPAPFQANPNEDLFTVKAPDPPSEAMLNYLETHMQKLHDALMGTSGEAYTQYIDVDSWVDFLIMQELSKNVDGNLKTSCYFIKEPDSDLVRMTALWDFDNAYGTANWSNASWEHNDYWDCPTGTGTGEFMVINSSCPWYKTLYGKEEFAAKVKETYTQYRYTILPEMEKLIDQQQAYLAEAVAKDGRWTSTSRFNSAVRTLKTWLSGRMEWLDGQWLLTPAVTVVPGAATVAAGGSCPFTATVTGLADKTVSWSVSGGTSPDTVVDASGLLHLGRNETADTLTVTATAVVEGVTGSATVQVEQGEEPTDPGSIFEAVEAAKKAAEAAQKSAEEAQTAAEEARKAAQEAAASAAEDKAAAEEAAREARRAEETAREALEAAEVAQKAAEAAAKAAEESNLAAAREAARAAQEAEAAAASAAAATEYARKASEAQKGAQTAQAAAEAAQAKAEAAQKAAEDARAAAEEAAKTAGEDSAEAQKARDQAEAAKDAAEAALKAAEDAQTAAETARDAARAHDEAAAASAAEAAKYAADVAAKYEEICAMKLEMAQYLLEAQRIQLACAKYDALFELTGYADGENYTEAQEAQLSQAVTAGIKAIQEAETMADLEKALAEAKAAIDKIKAQEAERLPFTDVAQGKWYYESVQYVYENGLFRGVTDTAFAPNGTMNRAMMITVLYRLAGEPAVSGATSFTDVRSNAYYYDALLWATGNGIAKGVTDTTFAPGSPITREQMVTFLYRYAELTGRDVGASAELKNFADGGDVSKYAASAMGWAVAQGIVVGEKTPTGMLLTPKATATRAQVATVLMRLAQPE